MTEGNLSPLTIIYLPRTERLSPHYPHGNFGERVFYYEKNPQPQEKQRRKVTTPSGSSITTYAPVELDQLMLLEGVNFGIKAEIWDKINSKESQKQETDKLIGDRIITIYRPDPGKQGRDSTDFSNFQELADIITNCKDENWLQLSLQVETRAEAGNDVRKLLSERFTLLQQQNAGKKLTTYGSSI